MFTSGPLPSVTYGDRGDDLLNEESIFVNHGFLAEVCKEWETSHQSVVDLTKRNLILRIGIVLSMQGGALPKMVCPLKLFANPHFASGKQYYSWIHIEDLCRMLIYGLENRELDGIYNAVAPNPVSAQKFAASLSQTLNRRAIPFSIPEFLMKIILGEMATTVIWSQRVSSEKMESAGFEYKFATLVKAFKDLL